MYKRQEPGTPETNRLLAQALFQPPAGLKARNGGGGQLAGHLGFGVGEGLGLCLLYTSHVRHCTIDLGAVTTVVLDEADEMLNMGFYKDVRHIIELMKARKSLSMF